MLIINLSKLYAISIVITQNCFLSLLNGKNYLPALEEIVLPYRSETFFF